ncbi:hypothetical protein [Desertibaculum subflavum]|uniref:hypothetical protein n=1 Tax=Desertibaculum subflavum TaxID=2268458 RepID=UPI0013C43562
MASFPAAGQGVTLNVIHDRSQGTVRINGVPVHRFASRPPFDAPATNAFNIGFWAENGDNDVAVEAEPVAGQAGASTKVVLTEEPGDPPLFEHTIGGRGSVSHKVPLEGLPSWSWRDAEAVAGSDSELLAAVAALHRAHADQDVDAILALSQAAVDDMTQVAGPMPPEARAEMVEMLKAGRLTPLPEKLTVERHLGNRLLVVTAEGGRAPIELHSDAMPDHPMETGRYWVRRNGKWSVVRW